MRTSPPPRSMLTATLFATAILVALLATAWGDRRVVIALAGLWIAAAVGNVATVTFLLPKVGQDRGEDLRAIFNIAVHVPLAMIAHWSFASWLFLPFLIGLSPATRLSYRRVLLTLGAFDVAALLTGGRWQDAIAFSGIGLFVHFVIATDLGFAINLLSDRDRALQELREAQQMAIAQEKLASIGQIAAGMAHEINNPMCFITANVSDLLDEIQREPDLPASLIDYRESIIPETIDGILRVNSIVDDLRRFAQGEPERFVTFDLATEITVAVRIARTQLKPDQQLHLELPPTIQARGMPRQICQVVLNLIVNGLQALDRQGEVRVSAVEHPDTVEVSVTDTGMGMNAETVERIFQPFFTTKKQHKGVGLGLALVRNIVQSHGGSIAVESSPGNGSCFRLRLPRLAREPRASAPSGDSPPSGSESEDG